MPGWSLEELLEARELVNPEVSEQMLRERYDRYPSISFSLKFIFHVLTYQICSSDHQQK